MDRFCSSVYATTLLTLAPDLNAGRDIANRLKKILTTDIPPIEPSMCCAAAACK